MTLAKLIANALGSPLELPDAEVTGIAQDHRRVKPGYLFVARQGEAFDGHRFAEAAITAGAVAVVGHDPSLVALPDTVPYIRVEDDRRALARLAATFYAHPSRTLITCGVTGTDGKTTTSFILHHLLQASHPTGLLSTADVRMGERSLGLEGHFTTPEATEVQRLLARFRDEACTHAVIEASSHGFALRRLDEVAFDLGLWTNLSPEHLDFHGTLEAYIDAKLELVRRAEVSVLNRDDKAYDVFRAAASKSLSYGEHAEADWRILRVEADAGGQFFTMQVEGRSHAAYLPMVGSYNVHNAVAAVAAARCAGIPLGALLERLKTFSGVPGRMQVVQGEPFLAVVDFAHTPPALEKALRTLRPVTPGRLIVVIGAAGERDPGKRPRLGEVATREAEIAIFTEEDSRSEDTGAILGEMVQGAQRAGGEAARTYRCIADRREAIDVAVSLAGPGDTLLFAGKGHERSLERSNEILPWDEVAEVQRALIHRPDFGSSGFGYPSE